MAHLLNCRLKNHTVLPIMFLLQIALGACSSIKVRIPAGQGFADHSASSTSQENQLEVLRGICEIREVSNCIDPSPNKNAPCGVESEAQFLTSVRIDGPTHSYGDSRGWLKIRSLGESLQRVDLFSVFGVDAFTSNSSNEIVFLKTTLKNVKEEKAVSAIIKPDQRLELPENLRSLSDENLKNPSLVSYFSSISFDGKIFRGHCSVKREGSAVPNSD